MIKSIAISIMNWNNHTDLYWLYWQLTAKINSGWKSKPTQYLQIHLHDDDNDLVYCSNKWVRPSHHNVLNYFHTSKDCTIIKETKPGCPRIYIYIYIWNWQNMIIQPPQAHNHRKIWQQWESLIIHTFLLLKRWGNSPFYTCHYGNVFHSISFS